MNITEREKVYFKILIQLNDEIKNIITLLNKIEKHGVTWSNIRGKQYNFYI
jgi:hypothetical protein